MPQKTITIGGLVLTQEGSSYIYEVEGLQGLRLQFRPGWKSDVATATVQFPKGCELCSSSGSYRDAIVGALDSMKQTLEQKARRANKNLADFNAQHAEIMVRLLENPQKTED